MKMMNACIIIVVLGLAASWSDAWGVWPDLGAGTGDITPKPVDTPGPSGPLVGGPELRVKRDYHPPSGIPVESCWNIEGDCYLYDADLGQMKRLSPCQTSCQYISSGYR